jgi:hypothetical protein
MKIIRSVSGYVWASLLALLGLAVVFLFTSSGTEGGTLKDMSAAKGESLASESSAAGSCSVPYDRNYEAVLDEQAQGAENDFYAGCGGLF